MLKDGKLNAYWIMCNNNLQTAPNTNNETYPGYRNPANLIVCSDPYPTVTGMGADIVLPPRCGSRKRGRSATPNGAPISGTNSWSPPARPARIFWQLMEFSKRFTTDEVWPAEILARAPEYRNKSLYDVLFRNGQVDRFPLSEMEAGYENIEGKQCGFYVQKGLFEEYASFGRGHGHDLAPFDMYHQVRGMRWPVVDGKETRWRYREGFDPYVEEGIGRPILRQPGQESEPDRGAVRASGRVPGRGIRYVACDRACVGALALWLDDSARP